jgi:hypothetical protein
MEALLILAFYALVALLMIRVRRLNLAIAALVLTVLLVVALVLQATVSNRIGGYAALGLMLATTMVALALRLGAWVGSGGTDGDDARSSHLD